MASRGRDDIQGLRALAVVLVIVAHAGVGGLAGGYIGVDVFFVVSGFLITGLLVKEHGSTGRIRLADFYARRARRILPASTVVLVVTLVYTAGTQSAAEVHRFLTDALWSGLFVANIHFARAGTSYLAPTDEPSPMQHFWSLAVEEQFYLVLPLLMLVLLGGGGRRRRRTVVLAVAAIWIVSLVWSVHSTAVAPEAAYFSSAARAFELATGSLLAFATPALRRWTGGGRGGIAGAGLGAILGAALVFDDTSAFPGWRALVPVIGTAAVLTAGTGVPDIARRGPTTWRPVRYLGDISYSLYLWHWPVLILEPVRGRTAQLLLVLVLSVLSHRFVELPFRHGLRPLRGRRSLMLWPAALVVVLAAGTGATWYGDAALANERAEAASYYRHHAPPPSPGERHGIEAEITGALELADKGAPLPPGLPTAAALERDVWQHEYPCWADFVQTRHSICPTGDRSAARTIVLYGDSHAGMWLPALDQIGRRDGFKVIPLVKIGCAPFDVPQLLDKAPYPKCDAFHAWARERIRELHPNHVILGFSSKFALDLPEGASETAAWRASVRRLARSLTNEFPKVTALGDVSGFDQPPITCLTGRGATLASCTAREDPVPMRVNELTRRSLTGTGVSLVDIRSLVCARGRCPLVVGRQVVFRDGRHVSASWARHVADSLEKVLGLRS